MNMKNADDSIRFNREPESIEIEESDLHRGQHNDSRTSTSHGISID
jgi:hypothetical protein